MPNFVTIPLGAASGGIREIYDKSVTFWLSIYLQQNFLAVAPRSEPPTYFDVRRLKRHRFTQGCAFWGSEIWKFIFNPYLPPKAVNICPKSGLRKFSTKQRLAMGTLDSKLPLIVVVAPMKLVSE